MDCTLRKGLKKEHENISNPIYAPGGVGAETMWICPLMGRQICHWCCLHIYNVAQPITRATASDYNPGYANNIARLTGRADLDDIWSTCSQCRKGG